MDRTLGQPVRSGVSAHHGSSHSRADMVDDKLNQRLRLLSIDPLEPRHDLVVCHSHNLRLAETPAFVAVTSDLSSQNIKNRIVHYDGQEIAVDQQTEKMLQILRRSGWLYIWFDVLCVEEKGSKHRAQLGSFVKNYASLHINLSLSGRENDEGGNTFESAIPERGLYTAEVGLVSHKTHSSANCNFRLIFLQPSASNFDMISCTQHDFSFEKTPDFVAAIAEADSTEDRDHLIFCDGEELHITGHTHSLLQHLRQEGWQRVWCSDICKIEGKPRLEGYIPMAIVQRASGVLRMSSQILKIARPSGEAASLLLPIAQFKYGRLRRESDIRLIKVHPPDQVNPNLAIDMHVVSLDSSPKYDAIATNVAAHGPNVPILCNRQLFLCPLSIVYALNTEQTPRLSYLFFDQVCGRGEDSKEMAHHQALNQRIRHQSNRLMLYNTPAYEYASLEDPNRFIRLLRLHPKHRLTDSTAARMVTTPLSHVPNYAALSYCWGSSERNRKMIIDSRCMEVTSSLHQALHELLENGYEYL